VDTVKHRNDNRPSGTERVSRFVIVLGIANWFIWVLLFNLLGGDGWGGLVEHGRYFVGNHGIYAEVSRATYHITRVYTVLSVTVFIAAGFAALVANVLDEHRRYP